MENEFYVTILIASLILLIQILMRFVKIITSTTNNYDERIKVENNIVLLLIIRSG